MDIVVTLNERNIIIKREELYATIHFGYGDILNFLIDEINNIYVIYTTFYIINSTAPRYLIIVDDQLNIFIKQLKDHILEAVVDSKVILRDSSFNYVIYDKHGQIQNTISNINIYSFITFDTELYCIYKNTIRSMACGDTYFKQINFTEKGELILTDYKDIGIFHFTYENETSVKSANVKVGKYKTKNSSQFCVNGTIINEPNYQGGQYVYGIIPRERVDWTFRESSKDDLVRFNLLNDEIETLNVLENVKKIVFLSEKLAIERRLSWSE